MSPSPTENISSHEATTPEAEKQDTIFSDLADFSEYEKTLKKARNYLYIIAAFQLLMGMYEYFTVAEYLKLWAFGIDAGIAAVFLGLALLSYKKPVLSFGLALVLFILLNLTFMYFDSANLYRGIIIKVFVVMALIKGLKDARTYEEMKRTLIGEGAVEFR